jgi:hypothetical protein
MLGQLAACATWKVQESAPEQVIAEQSPGSVNVTKTDGGRLTVWDPRVVGDSLVGFTEPEGFVQAAGKPRPDKVPVSVHLGEIEHLAVLKTNSAVFAVGIVIIGAVLIALSVIGQQAMGEAFPGG